MSNIIWCSRGWFPVYFGFCPNEKAWRREMKRLEVDDPPPYPNSDGRCSTFTIPDGATLAIVTIGEHIDAKDDSIAVAGLIVHESVHVWQKVRENIGERYPSSEFEAYAIQSISQQLMDAYATTRRR